GTSGSWPEDRQPPEARAPRTDHWSSRQSEPPSESRYIEHRAAPEPAVERSAPSDASAGGSGSGDAGDAKPKRRWWRRGLR
ncbi:MAG TPA: hypothetical protein VFQ07_10560, partial [Candidatus Polarisedimenticolia bacterium]|nr:hypothetical protein [Candidatus Polarisedimenticolia bacterium]